MIAAREMGQPYPSGMDKPYTRPAEPVHFSRDSMHVKPSPQLARTPPEGPRHGCELPAQEA